MHKIKRSWFILITLFLSFAGIAFAQAPETIFTPEVQNFALKFITSLALSHPIVATLITVMGTMRAWAKPLFTVVHTLVDLSPTKMDDGWLQSVQSFMCDTLIGRTLAYALDWLTSIKIVPPGHESDPSKPVGQ